ncbi:MAG TPA: tetratricopeptide repeat protein [Myxococcota bacterium]|nr:tetratricopeptide repeat protein [Myxococcota bacterium]
MTAYSLRDASRLFGISPARLRQWERSALVRPTALAEERPAFGFRDLVCIKAILVLLEHGVPLRRIRRSVEAVRERIPEVDEPVTSLRVWLEGSDRVVVRHGGALFEPSGQMVIDFALAPERPDDVALLAPRRDGAASPDPETALEWFEQGCRLDTRPDRFDAAIEAYRRAIEADPDFADAHCNLGTIYHQQERPEEAAACYRRALACDPKHVEANLNLASLFEEQGRNEAALAHYKAALRVDPLRGDAQLSTALLYEKLGLRRRARDHWRRYLQCAPTGAWAEVARKRVEERD